MAVKYYDREVRSGLGSRRKLSAFLESLLKKHRKVTRITLTYVFCNDTFLLDMNRQFLQHDTLTDIITFDLSERADELTGEIYISIDRIRENAAKYSAAYRHELHRVIFHGALHLCGFTDKDRKSRQEMTRQEDNCLRSYFALK